MKLSKFKEYIINNYGEEEWKDYESSYGYRINTAPKKEQRRELILDGTYIQYINNPSEELQLLAVEYEPSYIHYINNPSERVQLLVVRQDGYNIRYIKNPTDKVIQEATRCVDKPTIRTYILSHLENDLEETKKKKGKDEVKNI